MSFISCKTFTPRARNKDTSSTKELIFNGSFLYDEDLSSVTIIDSKINGDLLEITVEYSGGCENHDFNLVFNEMWKKSMPPKVSLFLEHDNGNDQCESIIQKTVQFDIKKLKENSKEVYIYLVGYSKSIKY